ncbi:MAG TPA: c-type cytochrome, partial [Verrucomicrobiae bacterium]|nr:c-type cytochrome [Verrucomicrobiae bacterium]
RSSADGDTKSTFMCSLPPGGESLTGILRSRPFTLPPQLRFFVAGHDGPPDKPRMNKNFIRLIEAGTGKELATAQPPRNDTAQPVVWDLKQFAGKTGYIEVTDANTGTGYAWLALGRFDPPVTRVPKIMPSQYDHRWQSAAELAAELRVTNIEPSLNTLFQNQSASEGTRAAAAKALMTLNAAAHARELGLVLTSPAEPEALREACASTLAESGSPSAPEILSGALAAAPQNLQMHIALAMASRPEGAEALLTAVEKGKASRHLLQDKTIRDRLMAAKPANLSERLETLTRGLPPEDAERQRLIDQRVAAFNQAKPSAELGTAVFKQNCAICHSLDGQGATIGPQLDGVGNRGAARIIEDVLDPSRNVDPAFRVTLLMLKDGDVESGLVRREEGEMLVIAEGNGKERSIPKADITGKRSSQLSLMPDNFSQIIPTNDFYNLIAYLSSKSTKGSASR